MKTPRRYLIPEIIVFSTLAIVNCDGESNEKTLQANGDHVSSKSNEKDKAAVVPGVKHTVEEGQTLWDIARAYNVSIEQIMQANGFTAKNIRRLKKGARIHIPGAKRVMPVETAADRAAKREQLPPLKDGAYHFLRKGESLWTLANLYDVAIETLLERNDFSDDDVGRMRIGQPVVIPGISASQVKKSEAKKQIGLVHVVEKGETVWDLAYTFQVSVSEIMAANSLSAQEVEIIRDGTKLFIPGVESDRRGRIRRKLSARDRRAGRVAKRLGLGTRRAALMLLHGKVERQWIRAADGNKRFAGTLRWPVAKGWFTRGYGSGEGGYHLAVDIMGKIGWNVRAAAPGIVAYSGNELRGYGNAVLVIHPGGWVTMYAHNSMNFVRAGDKVPRGAILAELGSTGISRGPHVHFEFIYNGKNCDPVALFRPGVRRRSGKLSKIKSVKWIRPNTKPKAVRCAPRRRHPRSRWVIHEDPIDPKESDSNKP